MLGRWRTNQVRGRWPSRREEQPFACPQNVNGLRPRFRKNSAEKPLDSRMDGCGRQQAELWFDLCHGMQSHTLRATSARSQSQRQRQRPVTPAERTRTERASWHDPARGKDNEWPRTDDESAFSDTIFDEGGPRHRRRATVSQGIVRLEVDRPGSSDGPPARGRNGMNATHHQDADHP